MKTTLFILAQLFFSAVGFAQSADETAIKNVIAAETTAFHQRNANKTMSYWANVPYASHYYTEKGMGYVRGYDAISKSVKAVISRLPADNNVYKTHDYLLHVNGTSAWVSYITDIQTGTKKRQTHDARYLEKVSGTWKLVSVVSTPAL
ncbi:nuclear transport factor 2 family protein [Spirosoma pulveris]